MCNDTPKRIVLGDEEHAKESMRAMEGEAAQGGYNPQSSVLRWCLKEVSCEPSSCVIEVGETHELVNTGWTILGGGQLRPGRVSHTDTPLCSQQVEWAYNPDTGLWSGWGIGYWKAEVLEWPARATLKELRNAFVKGIGSSSYIPPLKPFSLLPENPKQAAYVSLTLVYPHGDPLPDGNHGAVDYLPSWGV